MIRAILRPGSRPNEPVWAEEEAEPERRRKYRQAIDGIHLLGHKLAGRDLFVAGLTGDTNSSEHTLTFSE